MVIENTQQEGTLKIAGSRTLRDAKSLSSIPFTKATLKDQSISKTCVLIFGVKFGGMI